MIWLKRILLVHFLILIYTRVLFFQHHRVQGGELCIWLVSRRMTPLFHFGKDVASVFHESCKQIPLKTDLTTNAKHKHSLEGIRIGFSLILAPNLDLGRVVGTSIFRAFWALGPSSYRDGLHLSQEAFLAAISHWYSWISMNLQWIASVCSSCSCHSPSPGTACDFR